MASSRRLQKELADLKRANLTTFRVTVLDNILNWSCLLIPEEAPYNKGAYKLSIDFPAAYPFKPPKVTFLTKIYHPNIDENGQICLPIISDENWKPATKTEQVIASLLYLVQEPDLDSPLRADLADQCRNDRQLFNKNAEEFAKKHAEPVPS